MYYKKYGTMPKAFGGIIDDVLHNGWSKFLADDHGVQTFIPVNIKETDAAYELHVVAPGLRKEDFKINLEQDILTISFEHKDEKKEEGTEKQEGKWLRNEYHFRSFKRSFTLNDKVNAAGINAKYTDGVLFITLPKKEAAEPTSQQINVA